MVKLKRSEAIWKAGGLPLVLVCRMYQSAASGSYLSFLSLQTAKLPRASDFPGQTPTTHLKNENAGMLVTLSKFPSAVCVQLHKTGLHVTTLKFPTMLLSQPALLKGHCSWEEPLYCWRMSTTRAGNRCMGSCRNI